MHKILLHEMIHVLQYNKNLICQSSSDDMVHGQYFENWAKYLTELSGFEISRYTDFENKLTNSKTRQIRKDLQNRLNNK